MQSVRIHSTSSTHASEAPAVVLVVLVVLAAASSEVVGVVPTNVMVVVPRGSIEPDSGPVVWLTTTPCAWCRCGIEY